MSDDLTSKTRNLVDEWKRAKRRACGTIKDSKAEDIEPPPQLWEISIHGLPVAQPRVKARSVKGIAQVYPVTTLDATKHLPIRPHPIVAWKDAARRASRQLIGPSEWIIGPVQVDCEFVFPRPAVKIWKTRPMPRERHTSKPDRDNLDKAILDALTPILWRDDAQVCAGYLEKWVAAGDEEPRAVIRVTLLEGSRIEPISITGSF
jgi:Holliday junction resolvase RusA-like endonuclease